ncbi:unnamed protein product [Symbiodinium sp. CCMP2592]|nr:unnamed protein product [Symbiodinium sp. CCMP2592]
MSRRHRGLPAALAFATGGALWGRCLLVPLVGTPPRNVDFERLRGPNDVLDIAVCRSFLNEDEISIAMAIAQDGEAWAIDDRDDDLGYAHEVWRIEEVLQLQEPGFFQKLIASAWSVEKRMWGNILEFVFPEIEYIEYDVKKLGRPGSIARHTDNDSLITMVVLLSDTSDFLGGINCFEGAPDERKVPLQRGDACFFFGHCCHHWITPVTTGCRRILQMELRNRYEEPPSRIRRCETWGAKRVGENVLKKQELGQLDGDVEFGVSDQR